LSVLIAQSVCVLAQEDNARDKGEFSGNFETTNQFYVKDSAIGATTTQYQKELSSTDAWLYLYYKIKGFNFTLRYDLFNNSPLLNPQEAYTQSGIGFWSITKEIDNFNLTVGSFYDQFATGMVFRSYEDRNLGLDFAIQGVRLIWTPSESLKVKAFTGRQKFRFDVRPEIIKGVNIEKSYAINDNMSISPGASLVNRTIDQNTMNTIAASINNYDLENRFIPRYNAFVYNFYNVFNYKNFSWYVEYCRKDSEAVVNPISNIMQLRDGRIYYTSLSYSTKGIGINSQYKRIESFSFRTSPLENLNQGMIAYLPSLTRQNAYRLLSRYNAFVQEYGENAIQVEITIKPKALRKYQTAFNLNTSVVTGKDNFKLKTLNPVNFSTDTTRYYREYYFDVTHKLSKATKLIAGYQYVNYNQQLFEAKPNAPYVFANTVFGELTYKFNQTKSIRVEAQYLSSKQDLGSFANGLVEYNVAPHYSISVGDMVNTKYGYRNKPAAGQKFELVHYWNIFGAYTFKTTRITGGYIKQVEGVNCTGGVCRIEPAFSGARLTLTTNF